MQGKGRAVSDKRFSRPLVGVGVVLWREDRVLLVRRGRPPGEGEWSIPGGKQELGETVFEAARREVAEETGLQVALTGLVDVVDLIRKDGDGGVELHYTLVDLLAESCGGDARAGSDIAEVCWANPADLGAFDLWSETVRIIGKAKSMRAAASRAAKS